MRFSRLIIFTLISTVITDAFRYLGWVEALNIANSTYISTSLNYFSLIIIAFIAYKTRYDSEVSVWPKTLFKLWLILNVFNFARGLFVASSYWDWKFLMLSSLTFSLIALVFFIGNNLNCVIEIFHFYLKYIFILGFAIIPLALITNEELYSRLMIPISFFILFIPYLKPRWRLLIVIVAIVSILVVVGFRTNILKIAISVLLLTLFYFRKFIKQRIIRFIHFILFALPLIFIFLATTGSYNILKELSKKENYTIENREGKSENLLSDTRTFLYEEVAASLDGPVAWFLGKSSSQGYHSKWFYDNGGTMNDVRYHSEVNILNILLYHGFIGVFIYFLLLFSVSYQAIVNSNNILSKMIGLLIASRWSLSFLEEFTQFDLNFYFFWLIMGLVSTTLFKSLSDEEIYCYFSVI